jgi:hypothetical protein
MRGHSGIERSAHHEVIVVMFAGEREALRLLYT